MQPGEDVRDAICATWPLHGKPHRAKSMLISYAAACHVVLYVVLYAVPVLQEKVVTRSKDEALELIQVCVCVRCVRWLYVCVIFAADCVCTCGYLLCSQLMHPASGSASAKTQCTNLCLPAPTHPDQ